MLGNIFRETGVVERLNKTAQNELMNIVTIFLGISVGATATAATFLSLDTLKIIVLGVVRIPESVLPEAYWFPKIHEPLPQRKDQSVDRFCRRFCRPDGGGYRRLSDKKENPGNFLLMHAMGPNVAGVISSAIAAGVFFRIVRLTEV